MKWCWDCQTTKPANDFYAAKARCIECVRADNLKRYWRNRKRYAAVALARWRRLRDEMLTGDRA